MNYGDFTPGTPVELEVAAFGKKQCLPTAVEHVVEDVALLTPIRLNGKLVGFPPSCAVNLLYSANEHVYVWRNVAVKAITYKGTPYHSVRLIGDAEVVNRRGAYRVYIGKTMKVTTFTTEGPKNMEVLIRDISETGFSFFSTEALDLGRVVRLNLDLTKGFLKLSATIVRTQEMEQQKNGLLYGCKFTERNQLLPSYLMAVQRERQQSRMASLSLR